MEKYCKDALKWSDENQLHLNARELFTNKIKEAEDYFAPFNATVACKLIHYSTPCLLLISFSSISRRNGFE